MKSTPIVEMENVTGLHSLDERKATKILTQHAKFKRLKNHPMRTRLAENTSTRLKRGSFLHTTKNLVREQPDLLNQEPTDIPVCFSEPPWENHAEIIDTIPGIQPKGIQSVSARRAISEEHIQTTFPRDTWIHVYTDGSSLNGTQNGGAGIYIQYPSESEERISLPVGAHSTELKAETIALQIAFSAMIKRTNSPRK